MLEFESAITGLPQTRPFYNLTRPAIERMARQKSGAVVSMSSAASLVPNRGQSNYAAAKAGLNAASRSLAAEVARLGIRVNVVAPGLIETGMIESAPKEQIKQLIPMARIGRPEEVAAVPSAFRPFLKLLLSSEEHS